MPTVCWWPRTSWTEVVRNFMSSSMSAEAELMSRDSKISWKWVLEPNNGLSKPFRESSIGIFPS